VEDILTQAEALGKQIAEHDRFRAVREARKAADEDDTLQEQMKALGEQSAKIRRLEQETKPVEPEDKRRFRELQEQVTAHPAMQQLARAEADFAELMNRVQRAIRRPLSPAKPKEQ
jgi:cell fate (sporulation/competence/biofilm development) regulator YlbF (YheA/YmcA/DUF963 family)